MAEVYAGVRPEEQQHYADFFADMACFPVTFSIAKMAGELKSQLARRGITRGLHDMIVAATALEHNCLLATDNLKDFVLPELRLYPLL